MSDEERAVAISGDGIVFPQEFFRFFSSLLFGQLFMKPRLAQQRFILIDKMETKLNCGEHQYEQGWDKMRAC